MDKEDARFQTLKQLHERRKQVVRLHRKGIGVMRIVELSGLSYPAVRGVIDRYEREGVKSIKPAPRGKLRSEGRSLTDEQERSVRQIICDKRWGFTPQKPIKKAYEQRPEAVQTWLDETHPGIETRARAEGAEIHWGDETVLVNTDVRGRSHATAGKTPVAYTVGGTRQKLSMIQRCRPVPRTS